MHNRLVDVMAAMTGAEANTYAAAVIAVIAPVAATMVAIIVIVIVVTPVAAMPVSIVIIVIMIAPVAAMMTVASIAKPQHDAATSAVTAMTISNVVIVMSHLDHCAIRCGDAVTAPWRCVRNTNCRQKRNSARYSHKTEFHKIILLVQLPDNG